MAYDPEWRSKEPSIFEVIEKYSDVSPFVIIKTDIQRRGIAYTDAALATVNTDIHQTLNRSFAGEASDKNSKIPFALLLRDGTSIIAGPHRTSTGARDPLVVDVVDGKTVVTDNGKILEEVIFWEKPDFYDKFTTKGTPMWQIAWARPQRLDLNPYQDCQFWNTPGHGCKFCAIKGTYKISGKPDFVDIDEIDETVTEALKQKGRFTNIFLTGGSILSGKELLDDEVDNYINILQRIGKNFSQKKFPSQLIGTAFNKNQLKRLYENTGLMSYTADIEVLNKEVFDWVCPGKSSRIGYDEWKRRLYDAVEIFGPGYVNTGLVLGVELAKPNGFASEDIAFEKILLEAEDFMKNGISPVGCVWTVSPRSIFKNQFSPSLEYYVRVSRELDRLRRKYGINVDMDNYRRCGNHPDTDLSRI